MNYLSFQNKAGGYPLFRTEDALKWFPEAERRNVLNQLHLWVKKGHLKRIARGVYQLKEFKLPDSFALAAFLYGPSYVTLESALNAYGIIPDVPFSVTSAALPKTKTFRTKEYGIFFYHHIKPGLFFGFKTIAASNYKSYPYRIATPEKALFDYFYFRASKVRNAGGFLEELRLTLPPDFKFQEIRNWSKLVSPQKKTFHALINALIQIYALK